MTSSNQRRLKFKLLLVSAVATLAVTNIVYAAAAGPQAKCDRHLTGQADASIEALRQAMNDKDVGFAILEAPQFVSPKLIRKVYDRLPEFYQDSIFMADFTSTNPFALEFYGEDNQMRPFEQYLQWVTKQLRAALPDENLRVEYAELRKYEPGTDWQIQENVTALHKDGTYITVTIPFLGPGTLAVAKDKSEHENQIGQAMFVTGTERTAKTKVRATLHKAPSGLEVDRFVMVIRLGPLVSPD